MLGIKKSMGKDGLYIITRNNKHFCIVWTNDNKIKVDNTTLLLSDGEWHLEDATKFMFSDGTNSFSIRELQNKVVLNIDWQCLPEYNSEHLKGVADICLFGHNNFKIGVLRNTFIYTLYFKNMLLPFKIDMTNGYVILYCGDIVDDKKGVFELDPLFVNDNVLILAHTTCDDKKNLIIFDFTDENTLTVYVNDIEKLRLELSDLVMYDFFNK